jgi:ABC-type transport system substrate-binding protein
VSSLPPFVMPERLAKTDPYQQVTETVGSGPFKFVTEEFQPGHKAVYVKNTAYLPRDEPPSWASGGKVAKVDRVEWLYVPDYATTAAALGDGEIDWWEAPALDLVPVRRGRYADRAQPWPGSIRAPEKSWGSTPSSLLAIGAPWSSGGHRRSRRRRVAGASSAPAGTGVETLDPSADLPLAANGGAAWIAVKIQQRAFETVPYIPTGQWSPVTSYRKNIKGIIIAPALFLWNVEKT